MPTDADPSEPKQVDKRRAWIVGSLSGLCLLALGIGIGSWFVSTPQATLPQKQANKEALPPQTEAIFVKHFPTQPEEWLAARADHQLVAYALFNCKQLSDVTIDTMPRQIFSALLLDLTPSGNHVFAIDTKDGDDVLMATRDKNAKPIVLTGAERELLSFSDLVARARLAAAAGAHTVAPIARQLGFITLIVTALATLFVTLQGKMEPVKEEPEGYRSWGIFWRVGIKLFGLGAGFRWVAFLAVALSIAGTSLTGLKQVFDPTRTLTQNTRAVVDLRQLHQELTFGIKCSNGEITSNIKPQWFEAMRRITGTIIPDYGAFANLDIGSVSPRQVIPISDSNSGNSPPAAEPPSASKTAPRPPSPPAK